VLDSHPEIYGGPEFDRIPFIIDLRKLFQQSICSGRIDVYCNESDVDRALARMIEDLLLPVADRAQRRYLSEKSPFNVLVFRDLMDIFPDARFIHVVRHPLGVLASMDGVVARAKLQGKQPPPDLADDQRALAIMRDCFRAGFASSRAAPQRVHTLVYERLIAEPEVVTRELCDFLRIGWHSRMLEPASQAHAGERAAVDGLWYNQAMFRRNFDPSRLEAWKLEIDDARRQRVKSALAHIPELTALGYFSDDARPAESQAA
jgi:hypothetical protein